jgi:hypothetical protein
VRALSHYETAVREAEWIVFNRCPHNLALAVKYDERLVDGVGDNASEETVTGGSIAAIVRVFGFDGRFASERSQAE